MTTTQPRRRILTNRQPAVRGRPKRDKDEAATRDRILQAAASAFHTMGFEGASMKKLAQLVGITPAALYWHFKSKQDILFALLESKMENFVNYVLAAPTAAPPADQLAQIAAAHARWQLSQQDILGFIGTTHSIYVLASGLASKRQAVLHDWQRKYLDRLVKILRDGVCQKVFAIDEVTATALMVIAMCDHVTTWFKSNGKLSRETVAQMHAELAVRMVSVASKTSVSSIVAPEVAQSLQNASKQ